MSVEKFRGKWRYRRVVKLPNGEKIRISGVPTVDTKGATEAAELNHINRILNPGIVQAQTAQIVDYTFRQWIPKYLELSGVTDKHSTKIIKRRCMAEALIPFFGDMKLSGISFADVQDFIAHRLQKDCKATVNMRLGVLGHCFSMAHKRKLITAVPETKKLRIEDEEFDFLTFAEADKLIHAATGTWGVMIHLAIRTGMRPGEILALRWKDVDLDARRVIVRQTYGDGEISTPKSNKFREIGLAPDIWAVMKAHKETAKHEYCFTRANGCLLRSRVRPLRSALKAAGIRATITWKDLRHTFASHLVMRGISLYVVQSLMGHASYKMTQRYAHLAPDVKTAAVDSLATPWMGHGTGLVSGVSEGIQVTNSIHFV